jgi:hypothetical protein
VGGGKYAGGGNKLEGGGGRVEALLVLFCIAWVRMFLSTWLYTQQHIWTSVVW